MSRTAWGAFEIKCTDLAWKDYVELAFKAVEIATKNRIGITLGFNVRPEYYKEFKSWRRYIQFSLLDDPRSNVAETLFAGDGIKQYIGEERVDTGESLASRMLRVQSFLEEILCSDSVEGLILHIHGDYGEEYTLEIKAKDYQKTILELYKKEGNWAPTIRFNITK